MLPELQSDKRVAFGMLLQQRIDEQNSHLLHSSSQVVVKYTGFMLPSCMAFGMLCQDGDRVLSLFIYRAKNPTKRQPSQQQQQKNQEDQKERKDLLPVSCRTSQ